MLVSTKILNLPWFFLTFPCFYTVKTGSPFIYDIRAFDTAVFCCVSCNIASVVADFGFRYRTLLFDGCVAFVFVPNWSFFLLSDLSAIPPYPVYMISRLLIPPFFDAVTAIFCLQWPILITIVKRTDTIIKTTGLFDHCVTLFSITIDNKA